MSASASRAVEITVRNFQKTLSLKPVSVENTIRRILAACRVTRAELAFVFVSRQKITALNKRFLGRAYATDVLAFDLSEQERTSASSAAAGRKVLRGDIIISADAALSQSRRFDLTPERELTLYMIHGILHLLGYDDHSAGDIARMRAEEQRILNLLGSNV